MYRACLCLIEFARNALSTCLLTRDLQVMQTNFAFK